MGRPGKQISYLDKFKRPPTPFEVQTDITATDMAFGHDRGMLEFIAKECSLGDWGFDAGPGGKLIFSFADESDAVLFKMKFVG